MGTIRAVFTLCGGIILMAWRKVVVADPLSILHQKLADLQCTQVPFCSTELRQEKDVKNIHPQEKVDTIPDPGHLEHFKKSSTPSTVVSVTGKDPPPIDTHALPHPIWSEEELQSVQITHKPPKGFVDKMAFYGVKVMRRSFDIFSLFNCGERTEKKWILRICLLETVAGVPCMVAAITRHVHSLQRMQRDYGWIHTLLEEAENERMHLMTALQLRQPSGLFRMSVLVAQGVFVNVFALSFLISPRFCHRFVGYLDEEAVYTYTKCLQDIESGSMQHWKTTSAPEVAKTYWKLAPEANMKDVILVIRADEAHHRTVNHTFASLKEDE